MQKKFFGYTLADTHPEAYALADKFIPGVWGSCRDAWMKGYLGMKVKFVKTSAAERFYKMGKKAKKEESCKA